MGFESLGPWPRRPPPSGFHLAFWPGVLLGVSRTVETFVKVDILPADLALGVGKYALDLGVNVYGLVLCTLGYVVGAVVAAALDRARPVHARVEAT